jgi:cysteine desulfurase/selenocysteine lyase
VLDGLSIIRGARVLGPGGLQARAPVISFALDGAHPHDVCQILDDRGVALRGGHHCAQPLMDRFGLAGTTRTSLALYNDDADIDALLSGLDEAARRLR